MKLENSKDNTFINEAAYWLGLINASGLKLSILKPIVQEWYLMAGKSIIDLFNQSVFELANQFNLTDKEAEALLKSAESHPKQLKLIETWREQGIEVLPLSHPHFPARLIYTLPPKQQPLVLWATGQTRLLTEPTITVLGGPEPTEETITFIQTLTQTLVEENIGIISGYGKGLDRIAFESVLAADTGPAIAVLPMGLTAFAKLTTKLNPAVAAGQALLVSPFPPETSFDETLAEARNMLVDALALALLVPHVDETSQPRANAALERGMPVLVDMTDSASNRDLIAAGAFLMTDLEEVVEMVQQAIIDNALQAQISQKEATLTPPPGAPVLNSDDDYSLGSEAAPPLAADEVLDILGNVPTSLRERLMALEKQRATEEKDS